MTLMMIVPSRGRPANIAALIEAWRVTVTGDTQLVVALDDDDLELGSYQALPRLIGPTPIRYLVHQRLRMVGTLNFWATRFAHQVEHIGFLGDDHRPRTRGWDEQFTEVLTAMGTGIVYGDDGIQGVALPTAVAMSSSIVQALGYMAPPSLQHLYVDNVWLQWGHMAGVIRYLPDVVIEHLHPVARKADWDASYLETNSSDQYARDRRAYDEYVGTRLHEDVALLHALVGR